MRKIVLPLLLTAFYLLPAITSAQSVDLIWEADTYVPPFYKGLPLWTNESQANFVAVPHIPGYNPDTLIYRWSKNRTVLGSLSGVNKRSLSVSDTVLSEPVEVTIDVFENNGASPLASKSVRLTPTSSKLVVVEDSPLHGLLLNKSVKQEFVLSKDEVTFSAIPFFATVSTRVAGALEYSWATNIGEKRAGNSVTYRLPEEGSGSASVTLRSNDSKMIVQPKPINFLIKFDRETNF